MNSRVTPSTVVELHTVFGDGASFLSRWRAWREEKSHARLHVIAIHAEPPKVSSAPDDPLASNLAQALQEAPRSGMQSWQWEDGCVRLTLVVGPLLRALTELRLHADRVWVGDDAWGRGVEARAVAKALARLAAPHAELSKVSSDDATGRAVATALLAAGWVPEAQGPDAFRFTPPWVVKTTREPWRGWERPAGTCAVVGAGIAGAAVAAALARRGWRVTVLDESEQPASGASGLPVGLAAPYATADDSPLARLTRYGVRHLVRQAQQFLSEGEDWLLSGAHEIPMGGGTGPMHWQPHACWVKPAAMVRAWLSTSGVVFRGGSKVQGLRLSESAWELLDASGHVLDHADRVVLANAAGIGSAVAHSSDLLEQSAGKGWPQTHRVRGLVTWGCHAGLNPEVFPSAPVHGNGSLIAHVPFDNGSRWFVGASYQPVRDGEAQWPDDKNHGANALRLEKLAPGAFAALTPVLEAGGLRAWKGQRFVTADRMPLVGPVAQGMPDVWACAGFGSRGLSLVAVCAELLAAQWASEPWPVEASLAQALVPYRKGRQPL